MMDLLDKQINEENENDESLSVSDNNILSEK
jgi:hypothetical protein